MHLIDITLCCVNRATERAARRLIVAACTLTVWTTAALAQDPYVKITPASKTFAGVSTANVTIDYCYTNAGYAAPVVNVNYVDVTSSVSIDWVTPPAECEQMQRATFTVNLPAVVEGRYTLPGNYLYNDAVYYELAAPPRDVRVQAATQNKSVRASSAISMTYTVVNSGEAADSFTVSTTCSSGAVSGSCSVSPSSVVLAAQASATVTLTATSGTSLGAKSLAVVRAVSANDGTIRDSTWTELSIKAAPSAGIRIVNVTDDIDRGSCVTLAAGSNAAYECGDLRVVHSLPATTRKNRTRTPALLYSSHTASPAPTVGIEVTRGSGDPTPDYLEICVIVPSISLTECDNSAPPAAGETKRYTRILDGWSTQPTGRYAYTVEVAAVIGGTRTTQSVSSALAVVNRSASPYGPGWWLTGIDQIVGTPSSQDTLLWVGADGSTRTFGSIGTSGGIKRFLARTLDRPDTIHYNSGAGTLYRRHDNDRYTTYFNTTTGFYDRTESTYGQIVDQCTSMGSGGACQTWNMGADYTLRYTSNKLDSVNAPPLGSTERRTKLTWSSSRVSGITDPDNLSVSFTYSGATNRLASRTDRRGTVTNYSWQHTKLSQVELAAGQAENSITGLTPAEVVAPGTSAGVDPEAAYTEIDGPRSDVDDRTRIWLNAYGAAARVRDPHGNESLVTHDSTWKLLVHRTQNPLRLLSVAYYNNHGLTDSVLVTGSLGGSETAKTRFTWHSKWRSPVLVTDPVGTKDSSVYDATHGTLSLQQRGSGFAPVSYAYVASGNAAGQVARVIRPPSSATDSLFYDSHGNLSRSRSALGFVSLVYRDAAGRDTTSFTPIDSISPLDSANVVSTGVRSITRYDKMGRDTLQMTIGPMRAAARGVTHPKDSVWIAHSYDNEGNRTQTRRSYREVPAYVTTLTTYWVYDRLGRVTTYTPTTGTSSTFAYDVAGNQTLQTTPRSQQISSTYDALGRVTRRVVPEVNYGSVHCSVYDTQNPFCSFSFPTRGSSVCVPADTARFRYNAAGHLVNADNRWAQVRRDYTPAGLLVADTLRTRSWFVAINSACEEMDANDGAYYPLRFSTHVYGLGYEYDLAGRRIKLLHPNSIDPCSGRCEQRYAYGPTTGLLDTVVDFSGSAHRFAYDNAGRLTTRYAPGAVADARSYDLDDRLIRRTIPGLVADTLSLDAMGRSRVIRSGYPFAYTSELWYNGLGAVAAADNLTEQASAEDFTVDALGNRRFTRRPGSRTNSAHKDVDRMRTHEYDSGERLVATRDSLVTPSDSTSYNYLRMQQFDLSGNLAWRGEKELDVLISLNRYDHLVSYYGADEKLAVANRHIGISSVSDDANAGQRGVWEMHRYDALGRRVATRSMRGSACVQDHTECFPYVERTIWDGDQLLYEIRTPTPTAGGDTPAGGTYNAYGRVMYLHGGGIDAPLAITRMSLNGQPADVTLAPHADWQGAYVGGTLMDGTIQSSCAPSSGCPTVEWLGGKTTTDGVPVTTVPSLTGWWGSLVQQQVDASGLRYQRNRFYDPSTGQFTQADPIGLAGGRNLYAFAGGDPVNFDDPFGLFECSRDDPKSCGFKDVLRNLATGFAASGTPGFGDDAGPGFRTGFAVGFLLQGYGARGFRGIASAERTAVAGTASTAGTRGLERQLQLHIKKLADYRSNPAAFDNLGMLERAPHPRFVSRSSTRASDRWRDRFACSNERFRRREGDMRVEIAELRALGSKLFDHLEANGVRHVELRHDHYWEVPAESRYNVYEQPSHLDVGQLTEDLASLQSMRTEPTIGYALVWLGAILREIGEQHVG